MLPGSSNWVRKALLEGKKVSSSWLQGCSGISAEIIASAGYDAAVIDMEHSPGDCLNLIGLIQAMQGYPIVPFVRSPWNDAVWIKRILDCGVKGLFIPYINNRAEAEAAVAAAQYPMAGIRGVAGSPRAVNYGYNSKEHILKANDDICVFLQIETPEGLANLDEILAVERVDGIVIGPMDLASSMGHFAEPAAPEVQKAIRTIEEKTMRAGKALCTVAGGWEDAAEKYRRGYNMIMFLSDTVSLAQVANSRLQSFKAEFGPK